jgi:isoaspartyl peptidase/L-asparaginase-like protein (Ntn-hydrolase superfamily)
MAEPLILSTWSFGKKANAAGWPYLTGPKASSLDAVEQACRVVEDDLEVISVGRGGRPDRSGEVSLDASIMLSPARCGAVCYVRRFAHPISIARLVMERLRHVLLAGDGADRFAMRQGLTPENLLTDSARSMWQQWAAEHPASERLDDTIYFPPPNQEEILNCDSANYLPAGERLPHNQDHDTVGVLAIDPAGQMAGACSTSGLAFKVPGRVGDSPIIGHGLYVDPKRGAAVATGMGELIMSVCASFLAVDRMGQGATPLDAAREALDRIVDSRDVGDEHQVAIITIHPSGKWSAAALRSGYNTAIRTPTRDELVEPDLVLLP